MDIFDQDILEFWRCLQSNAVRYIMVGGFATNMNGVQRFTSDLDIWIEDNADNRKKLRASFKQYGLGDFEAIENMPFIPDWTTFTLNNGLQLDIMSDMKGLEQFTFEECLSVASVADIEGVLVPFLHINQLIANKKATNRPKDQADVIELEKIKKLIDDEDAQNKL